MTLQTDTYVVKGFGKRLCPVCGCTCLRYYPKAAPTRDLFCNRCGWEGSIEECAAPSYVSDALFTSHYPGEV